MMLTPLPTGSPIGGWFWTWLVPPALYLLTAVSTWMLYRHFSKRPAGD